MYAVISCSVFVCFNDTSTTEIYTYLHTLSLPDALPICSSLVSAAAPFFSSLVSKRSKAIQSASRSARKRLVEKPGSSAALTGCRRVRSEEHTSELQSLMRTSYDVFCLKKKQITTLILRDKVSKHQVSNLYETR